MPERTYHGRNVRSGIDLLDVDRKGGRGGQGARGGNGGGDGDTRFFDTHALQLEFVLRGEVLLAEALLSFEHIFSKT